jgi:hypothetical protein
LTVTMFLGKQIVVHHENMLFLGSRHEATSKF